MFTCLQMIEKNPDFMEGKKFLTEVWSTFIEVNVLMKERGGGGGGDAASVL